MSGNSEVIIPIFGVLDITGEVIAMWIIVALLALMSVILSKNLKERPGKFQNMIEYGVEYLDNMFSSNLGKERCRKYIAFLGSLFVFIIFANYSGLIPGVGLTKYVKAPTSSLSVTAGLAIVSFFFLQIASIRALSLKGYLKRFVSPMFFMLPLLILDEFVKPLSLCLRLYGNVFGEETVTEELYNIFPVGVPMVMMILSLLFCALQAIVFTMLVSIYLDEATALEE